MWRELMIAAIEQTSITQVALDLGVSRTAISLIFHDKYPASPQHIAQRVMAVYGRVECPYLGQEISHAQCADYHTRRPPTSSPRAMKHWRTCQTCAHKDAQTHEPEISKEITQ